MTRPRLSASFIVATWFGSGLLKPAPGSWGSAAALPFAWAIASVFGSTALLWAALLVSLVGWAASARVVGESGVEDPQIIVVDEVVGQWMTLAFVPPHALPYLIGFLAFRAADILKPFPANWADRHVKGGLGVMLDDVLAAVYSCIVTTLLTRLV
jgi:phosphatidylglycerophosphatase A